MRKLARLAAVVSVLAWMATAGDTAGAAKHVAGTPLFTECPHIGDATGCQFLITVTDLATSIANDPAQPSYAANSAGTHESPPSTDALIGVRNDSSQPLTHLNISGSITFEFDGDGVCDNASGPVPAGCQAPGGSTACGPAAGPCSFPPPAGEPPSYREYGASHGTSPWPNGDNQNGYEGPTTWFSNIAPSPENSGTVNFSPALAPGASTYFSLEGNPTNLPFTTDVSTRQSGGGMSGATLYLPKGIRLQSKGSISGGEAHPSGQMTFQLFGRPACTGHAASTSAAKVAAGALGSGSAASARILLRRSGTYYWRVLYSGDGSDAPAETTCGSTRVVVPRIGRVGLPAKRRCVSSLRTALRVGRVRARSALVFANGRLLGRFGGTIRVHVRGRMSLSVIAGSRSRAFAGRKPRTSGLVQQSRIYRSC